MGVKVFIKGQEVPKKTIKDWEQKRVDFISDFLTKELGTPKVATAEELQEQRRHIGNAGKNLAGQDCFL